jgi:hypothetical protein
MHSWYLKQLYRLIFCSCRQGSLNFLSTCSNFSYNLKKQFVCDWCPLSDVPKVTASSLSLKHLLTDRSSYKEYITVLCSQAFGVPDPKVGEEICVFLRLRKGANLTEQDVRNYCKDKVNISSFITYVNPIVVSHNLRYSQLWLWRVLCHLL